MDKLKKKVKIALFYSQKFILSPQGHRQKPRVKVSPKRLSRKIDILIRSHMEVGLLSRAAVA